MKKIYIVFVYKYQKLRVKTGVRHSYIKHWIYLDIYLYILFIVTFIRDWRL